MGNWLSAIGYSRSAGWLTAFNSERQFRFAFGGVAKW
jgi:hypothetical protein